MEKVERNKKKLELEERIKRESLCLKIKSSKYEGETSLNTLITCNKILNMRRKRTCNQCNFIKMEVIRVDNEKKTYWQKTVCVYQVGDKKIWKVVAVINEVI